MRIFLSCSLALCLWFCSAHGQQDETKRKKGATPYNAILNLDASGFLKLFDKQGRGSVTKEEMPPRLAAFFDRADQNGDGKLDKSEIEQMLQVLKARMKADAKKAATPADGELLPRVQEIFSRMDTNKDGKISKSEAKARILENFDRIDLNKDGYIDAKELAQFVRQMGGPQGPVAGKMAKGPLGPGAAQALDFDSLDANADGRLSREEIKKTPYADKFAEIDTDKDGKISKKEWEAFLKKKSP